MDWYQHSTSSHDDPDISDAMDEFGHAGYSAFFITLELYGDEYNHVDNDGWLKLSLRFLSKKLRLSSTKVQQILNFYLERQRILVSYEGNRIYIKCPKYIDIASNWTKRKKAEPTESLCSPSVVPTAIEKEKEEEEEKEENKKEKEVVGDPFISIPLVDKSEYPIYPAMIEEWKNLYPKVDVEQSLRDIRGWNLANTTKRKTKSGIMKHINAWLAKEQNNGAGRGNPAGSSEAPAKAGRAQSDGTEYPTDHEF